MKALGQEPGVTEAELETRREGQEVRDQPDLQRMSVVTVGPWSPTKQLVRVSSLQNACSPPGVWPP